MKKIVSILVSFILCISLTGVASAKSNDVESFKKGDTTIYKLMESLQYLSDWGGEINYRGSGVFLVKGYTESRNEADKIYVNVALQQYNSSTKKWVTIYSFDKSLGGTDYVSTSKVYGVSTGYKYRVYSVHKVTNGSKIETQTAYSEIISAN
ncbi:MAG: hypothetical protein ACOYVK_21690 [Bacillota bacterium]